MAADNLRLAGWKVSCDHGTRYNEGQFVIEARKGEFRIVVSAPSVEVALLEAEGQARFLELPGD